MTQLPAQKSAVQDEQHVGGRERVGRVTGAALRRARRSIQPRGERLELGDAPRHASRCRAPAGFNLQILAEIVERGAEAFEPA